MKFEEFKKYKKIAESESFTDFDSLPDQAVKIYRWMDDSGRIDEGLWSSIWSWIKRNFSFRARRIHTLAEKYEKELAEEMKAEYGKLKDNKDLKARFRRSFAGKLAEEIHEKMLILAGDDEDYRDLVRNLINKKNLKVKTRMLEEFAGVLDDEDEDELRSEFRREEAKVDANYENIVKRMMSEGDVKSIFSSINSKIKSDPRTYEKIGVKSNTDVENFVKLIIYYLRARAERDSKIDVNRKTAEKIMKEYVELVEELVRRLESKCDSREECVKMVRDSLDHIIKKEKPQPLEKYKSTVYNEVEKFLTRKKGSEADIEDVIDDVTTPHTSVELTDDEVETAVDDAVGDDDDATTDDIVKEINSTVNKFFSKQSNVTYMVNSINAKVEKFNEASDAERARLMDKYDYELKDDKMEPITDDIARSLALNFKLLCGVIVPYYQLKEEKANDVLHTALRYMFEIYAVKKEPTGTLKSSDIETILDNIKTKYPDVYK